MVKSNVCFSRGLVFMPQHLHGSLHAMLAPEDPITSSGLHRYHINVLFRHLGREKTHIHKL